MDIIRSVMARLRTGGAKSGPRYELPDVPEVAGLPAGRYAPKVIERPAPVERPAPAERPQARMVSGVIGGAR